LDFTLSQPLWAGLNFNFAAKNILNKDLVRFYKLPKFVNQVEETAGHTVTDGLAAYELYPIGTSVSASLSWQIW
jgi:hypothetical protein